MKAIKTFILLPPLYYNPFCYTQKVVKPHSMRSSGMRIPHRKPMAGYSSARQLPVQAALVMSPMTRAISYSAFADSFYTKSSSM